LLTAEWAIIYQLSAILFPILILLNSVL